MINASTEFKNLIFNDCQFLSIVTIVLADSTELELTNEDILNDGITINQSLASKSSFQVGTVNSSSLNIKLINYDNRYEDINFVNARIEVKIGAQLSESTEYVDKGVYYVDKQTFNGGIVTLIAYDRIADFDTNYTGGYSGTAQSLIADIATKYSLNFVSTNMENASTQITIPENENSGYTDREIVSYICQITGNNAYINNEGDLVCRWYDFNKIEQFNYIKAHKEDTDSIVAGVFENMEDVEVFIQAGEFTDISTNLDTNPLIVTTIFGIPTIGREDVIITGTKFVSTGGTSGTSGVDSYIIEISGNPLALGKESEYASLLGDVVIGNSFRTVNFATIKNPLIEAGDIAIIDYRGKTYVTVLTNVDFSISRNLKLVCGAETAANTTSVRTSSASRAYKEATNYSQETLALYDYAMQNLLSLITKSYGIYKIIETTTDNDSIFYLSSKATLAESTGLPVWKMDGDSFKVTSSYQGNQTIWHDGISSTGVLYKNIFSIIGLNLSWLTGGGELSIGKANNGSGRVVIYDNSNAEVAYIDNTGININKGAISIGDFEVDSNGNLSAVNASLEGDINASSGSIGLYELVTNTNIDKGLSYVSSSITPDYDSKFLYHKIGDSTNSTPETITEISPYKGFYASKSENNSTDIVKSTRLNQDGLTMWDSDNSNGVNLAIDTDRVSFKQFSAVDETSGIVEISGTSKEFIKTDGSTTDIGVDTMAYLNDVAIICQASAPTPVVGKTIIWIQTS